MIRIGTRKSKLALWQANTVKQRLENKSEEAILVPMSSQGDLIQDKALHLIGGSGLFTKVLDQALLQNEIDLAVHSLKDYPTEIPEGLHLAAVLERAAAHDVLIYKGEAEFFSAKDLAGKLATGSPRRKAQWLYRYPNYEVVGLRGNVPTRLQKLADSDWHAAIFAKAGLERLDMLPENHLLLDWMVPAPGQGVIALICREADKDLIQKLAALNHSQTFLAGKIERDFLNRVEGGCSAPIGAHVSFQGNQLSFTSRINSPDGLKQFEQEEFLSIQGAEAAGVRFAEKALKEGAEEIMADIKTIANQEA
ncbi:MAG: hydroxymethylbilane synthase [Bacteroidota bacterium]